MVNDGTWPGFPHVPAKGKRGNKKGKRGREPTIVIFFFHRTTIDGESSQKLNKNGKTFLSRCGVYLATSRKDKSIKQKTKAGESEEKDKTFSAMWKKTKVFSKSSPLLKTLLLVLRCLAAFCHCHKLFWYLDIFTATFLCDPRISLTHALSGLAGASGMNDRMNRRINHHSLSCSE
jgi:hypothetical protein